MHSLFHEPANQPRTKSHKPHILAAAQLNLVSQHMRGKVQKQGKSSDRGSIVTTEVGTISSASNELVLHTNGSLVTIRHEDRGNIAILSNNPNNWQIDHNLITPKRQAGSPVGATAAGSNIIGNSPVITVSIGQNASIQAGDRNVSIMDGEIYVDGKKVGRDNQANCGPDRLEVVVPTLYRGGLSISAVGSEINLDFWQGSEISLHLSDGGLTAGNISLNGSCTVSSSGSGKLSFEKIEASSLHLHKGGSTNIDIDHLSVRVFAVTQSGPGSTRVRGGRAQSVTVRSVGLGEVSLGGEFTAGVTGPFHRLHTRSAF